MNKPVESWRQTLHSVIFEAETAAGKLFDILLLLCILLSMLTVILDSVASFRLRQGDALVIAEWFFTLLFTVEYILRILSVRRPWRYIFIFFGPHTALGKAFSSYVMILAMGSSPPTGIVSLEIAQAARQKTPSTTACPSWSREGRDDDAKSWKYYGSRR